VPGRPFKRRRRTADAKFDPTVQRSAVRITNVYATSWRLPVDRLTEQRSPSDLLRFGRLARYYRISADQLPTVVDRETMDPAGLALKRWGIGRTIVGARLWLFAVASGQLVVAFSLDVKVKLAGTIDLLEDCYYADIQIGELSLDAYVAATVAKYGGVGPAGAGILPERHQIAFSGSLPARTCEDVIQRVIYRSDLPYRKDFSAIGYPTELNRRPGSTAAVGPYVSAICGQQDYIENCAFISAVQAVASAARLREIRQIAYQAVREFRLGERGRESLSRRRRSLERLADQLSELELELSYSVEAAADLGLLVQSLRVESYHKALFDSMAMSARADTVARMLARLEGAIGAELTAIQSAERRADEDRRLRWTIAVGFVSTVAIPVSLVLAYFGVNAREVNSSRSIFDIHYLAVYVASALVMVIGAVLALLLYLQQRRRGNGYEPGGRELVWGQGADPL
jgi:hypothetical protein